MRDVRLALRILSKSPAFTLIAILTLAIGIGANTAIFTVANALLLRALPYQNADRLVLISGADFNHGGSWGRLSYPFYTRVEQHNRSFDRSAASIYDMFTLTGFGDPEQLNAARVTAGFFDVLGVQPLFGRTFLPEEDRPGGTNVVMLRYQFAARLFGDPKSALGRTITLDSRDYTVIGVLPPGFVFSLFGAPRDVWTCRVFDMNFVTPARVAAGGAYFNLIGRLRPGVSREQATTELQAIYQQYRRDLPGNYDASLNLTLGARDLQRELVSDVRPTVLILSAAVGLVLLIACANVASLLLSRALGRRKEFAVRTALGASRATLICQVLTESVLMAVAGGALGIALGHAGTRILVSLSTDALQSADLSIDPRVLLFTLAISLVSGVLFGIAPALQISKSGVNAALREEARGSTGNRLRNRARSALVVAQIALSMVLLVASGLLIRSFLRLSSASPGFDPQGVLSMQIMLAPAKYGKAAQAVAYYRSLLARVEEIPGIEAASLSTALPVQATHATPVLFEGQPALVLGQRPIVNLQQISPDYAKVMRIPLIAGRSFNDHDDPASPKVAIVNQLTVRRFFPNENPLGKRVWLGNIPEPYEIVGVMGDTKNNGPAQPAIPEVFLPYPQMTFPMLQVSVRSAGDPRGLVSAVRRAIGQVDKDQSVTEIKTMDELLESLHAQPRFVMFLLGAFAAVALVLAIVGIYGVIAYMVAQRTQEMGIRIALGAARRDILRLVIGSGMTLAGAGILIGLAASLAATRLMSSLLYQTSATDPVTLLLSAVLFLAVAAIASYVPARRATRIDPTDALRAE